MLLSTLLGSTLALAPPPAPPPMALPPTSTERELGQMFRLRTANFLAWRPGLSLVGGQPSWTVELASVWRTELSFVEPRLARLSFSVETSKSETTLGMITPQIGYQARDNLRVSVAGATITSFSTAGGARVFGGALRRPGLLIGGRF